ncbi:MAG TPA: nitroreductase [Deltaproteobacteria bacterium]|nr:nitroreductase [Deltaproteobacteria bacterium]HPR53786.1 nitroreductase [Deltaproteobacteria bacterium]HXK46803.1 nitroreductase [Deltaproteobacteria bacterium]
MLDLIRSRRSIRRFAGREVGDDLVDKVLDAGRWAPSGMDNQPWRFAVVRDRVMKEQVSRLTRYSAIVQGADVLIAVFLDTEAGYHRTKDVQAVGACIQNMLLAIHSLGLGGVWLGEILKSEGELRELLGAPGTYDLMAVIALGYPAEEMPEAPRRKELNRLVFFRK